MFSTVWYPRHSSFFWRLPWYPVLRETPSAGAQNTRQWEIFFNFWRKLPSISETVRERPMVAMQH